MLDYFYAACLLLLIASQIILIRSCFGLSREISPAGESISDEIKSLWTLLDEITDIISAVAESVPKVSPSQGGSLPEILLTALMGGKKMGGHGSEENNRQVHEIETPNESQTQNESN